MDLTEFGERVRRSADAIDTAAHWAAKHIRALKDCEEDPDLNADIGGKELGRLRARSKEIVQELAPLAEVAGAFLGVQPLIDADAIVLLDAAHSNVRSERGRIMIKGQGLTAEDRARSQRLERAEGHIQEAIKALTGGAQPPSTGA